MPDPTRKIAQSNTKNNIWNGISKGKYKLSFLLWVGMWVRKKKLKDTYTTIHSQFKQLNFYFGYGFPVGTERLNLKLEKKKIQIIV